MASNCIQSAAFVTARVRTQRHIPRGVVVVPGHVGPPELDRANAILAALAHIEDATTFRAEQPFVPVGGQRVDPGLLDIQRKGPKTLDRIDKEEAAAPPADLADGVQIGAITTEVLDETDGEQPRA